MIFDFLVGKDIRIASGKVGFIKEYFKPTNSFYITWYADDTKQKSISANNCNFNEILDIIKDHNLELKEEIKQTFPEYLF